MFFNYINSNNSNHDMGNIKYILIIVGYKINRTYDSDVKIINNYFIKIIGKPDGLFILDANDEMCYNNQYFEFGGIKKAIDIINSKKLFNVNIFLVNTTLIKSHSKIFIRYLIKDGLMWIDSMNYETSKNLLYGEIQKSNFDFQKYIPTYFMILNIKEPIKIQLLNSNVNSLVPFSVLKKIVRKDFRRYVLRWVSGKFIKGWYAASYGTKNIKNNYKRKLISMHYESIFYLKLLNYGIVINSNINQISRYKILDLLKNYMLKIENRIVEYYSYYFKK